MSKRHSYFVMGLEGEIEWPSIELRTMFRGHILILRPETNEHSPSLVLQIADTMTENDARCLLQEFLSGYAWIRQDGITETSSVVSYAFPMISKGIGRMINDTPVENIPDPEDSKARIALALYREAMSVNVIPYSFLSFFKIINVIHEKGNDQKKWINTNIPLLDDSWCLERIAELRKTETDLGKYFYTSGVARLLMRMLIL